MGPRPRAPFQPSLDAAQPAPSSVGSSLPPGRWLGPPEGDLTGPLLSATAFVALDLETTGGSPRDDRITEIGAVRVRGGEIEAELATLVDPGRPIPTAIVRLTGITDGTVAGLPGIEGLLPAIEELLSGAVLVAHNARFDRAFLDAALVRAGRERLTVDTVCTAALARRLLSDEVRNVRLATLVAHLRCPTLPTHRAPADARACLEVFHALLERAGSHGVVTLPDLLGFQRMRNTPVAMARRKLAAGLPHGPGVYLFRGTTAEGTRRGAEGPAGGQAAPDMGGSGLGEVLYVGKASDLRSRVAQYFGSDRRRGVMGLLRETARIDHERCPTVVEAGVRELRLIAAHRPRHNRAGIRRRPPVWLALSAEAYPRLVVTKDPAGRVALGPLPSSRQARQVADALLTAVPLRRCAQRLPAVPPQPDPPACALVELGRCPAPCDGRSDVAGYDPVARAAAAILEGDVGPAAARLRRRMGALALAQRFEEAADARDRLAALVDAVTRARRLATLPAATLLVASAPRDGGRLRELVVIASGRLAGSALVDPRGVRETAAALVATRPAAPTDAQAVSAEAETLFLARWLEHPGLRVHRCEGDYAWPVAGGRALADATAHLGRQRSRHPAEAAEDKRLRRAS